MSAFAQFDITQDANGQLRVPGGEIVPMVLSSFMLTGLATLIALLWQNAFQTLISPKVVMATTNSPQSWGNNVSVVQFHADEKASEEWRVRAIRRSFGLALAVTLLGVLVTISTAKFLNWSLRHKHKH